MKNLCFTALVLLLLAAAARAGGAAPHGPAVLTAGPGQAYPLPSDAARAARPGDTIRIRPGRYRDCIWLILDRLTIEGEGHGVVLDGGACGGKGILVASADNLTVRNLTFTGTHNIVHNGAGIRAEGAGLVVENSRFLDNDEGILAAANPASTITVRHSLFRGNGTCVSACAHGIYVGNIALLRVENCEFTAQQEGHNIKSRAARTEIVGNSVSDGPRGTSSYLVDLPAGGGALISGNRFEKGPRSANKLVAIAVGAELNGQPAPPGSIAIENNSFANDTGGPTVFVRNYSDVPVRLSGNRLPGLVTPLAGPGEVE